MDASAVLRRIGRLRVAVFGDLCLDIYLEVVRGGSERSRETGRRAAAVAQQRHSLGAAGNVAANAAALGAAAEAFSVVGEDPFGRELRRQLAGVGVDHEAVVSDAAWHTSAYIKHVAAGREVARFDTGVANSLADATAARLVASLERRLPHLDVVIINQQLARGVHTPATHRRLSDLIARRDGTVWVSDTRDPAAAYPGTIRKLGAEHLPRRMRRFSWGRRALRRLADRADVLRSLARELPAFATLGSRGAVLITGGRAHHVPAHRLEGPADPVGAGDAFVVGVALALAAGLSPLDAARLANAVAAVTVRQVGRTGIVTPAEVVALLARD